MSASHPLQLLPAAASWRLPKPVSVWTQRDYDIVQTLAIRLSLMAISQAVRLWWPKQSIQRHARRRLRQLVDAGLLLRYIINAHPLLEPKQPLVMWRPGEARPDCREASERARSRWNRPAIPTEVYTASRQAGNLFAGDSHGLPALEHRDHDLLLADAYVAYRTNRPQEATRWIGEDFLPTAGFRIKDPDAFLIDDAGRPMRVVESAGRYSRKQIASFHDHCRSLSVPYELW
jgi:hypothetical protein